MGISREPVSVRGWIEDVEGSSKGDTPTIETETARLQQLFAATSVWVEGSEFASGGVSDNGSFIVLDVPPGTVTLSFNAPGAQTAKVVLQDIPGNADVLLPSVLLKNEGSSILRPDDIRVRIPARIDKARPTGKTAVVAGIRVPVMEAPLAAFMDRRDYPAPGGMRPVARYK